MSAQTMVEVTQEDANNYCRVLAALGMEEEGDPVEEVKRLKAESEVLNREVYAETRAYAEGRKDERADWLPLLEAVRPFIEFNSSEEFITIQVRTADIAKARAAASYVEGN